MLLGYIWYYKCVIRIYMVLQVIYGIVSVLLGYTCVYGINRIYTSVLLEYIIMVLRV